MLHINLLDIPNNLQTFQAAISCFVILFAGNLLFTFEAGADTHCLPDVVQAFLAVRHN